MEKSTCKWRLDAGQIEVVDEAVAEILRQKTPAERIALSSEAQPTARLLISARLQEQQPGMDRGPNCSRSGPEDDSWSRPNYSGTRLTASKNWRFLTCSWGSIASIDIVVDLRLDIRQAILERLARD